MPTFISDPPPAVYLVLGFLTLITGVIAAPRQDRKSAIPFFVSFALLLAVFLVDHFFDSPREGAVKSAKAMADAADQNKPDDFVNHVADTITYRGEGTAVTATKSELKASPFWHMLRQFNAHVAVWNFSRDDVKPIDDDTVEIGFMAKGETRGDLKGVQLYVRGTFKRQPDDSMKMTEFRTFEAIDNRKPFTIPNFPK